MEDITDAIVPDGALLGVIVIVPAFERPHRRAGVALVGVVVPEVRADLRARVQDGDLRAVEVFQPVDNLGIRFEVGFVAVEVHVFAPEREDHADPAADVGKQRDQGPVTGAGGSVFQCLDVFARQHLLTGPGAGHLQRGQFDIFVPRVVTPVVALVEEPEENTEGSLVPVHPGAVGIQPVPVGFWCDERAQEPPEVPEGHVDQPGLGPFGCTAQLTQVIRECGSRSVFDIATILDEGTDGLPIAIVDVGGIELLPAPVQFLLESGGLVDVDHTHRSEAHMLGLTDRTCARCSADWGHNVPPDFI
ncbi:hypothetical protein ACFQL1_16105 [Halomicroarcula sp. GCM10025709]|uniref:hypothetical protein n=1 Tax=Halomicroarcula sp. GCM10025709 TaxID=3252669 RepID=UPI00360F6AFE